MTRIEDVIEKYNLYATDYRYIKNVRIITTEEEKIVIKEKKKDKKKLFSYLKSKGFPFGLEPLDFDDFLDYEIYPYIEQKVEKKEEKAIDMMYLLALLHNKTTFYKELDLDWVKTIYEDVLKRVDYLSYYYHDLQDVIEKKVYMAPDESFLICNMTLIYVSLEHTKNAIISWYEKIKNKKSIRYTLIHGNLSTSHFLQAQDSYLISWDHARRDIPIYDFFYFYKNEYANLDMISLFAIYQHKFLFTEEEKLLLFALLTLPDKIVLKKNTYNQYQEVYQFINYLNKTREFLLKQDETNQKTNK